jgi:formylglycine-generating enzyme required for sulfatase activity
MSDNPQESLTPEEQLNALEKLRDVLPPDIYNTQKAAFLAQINATQNIGMQISGGETKVEGDLAGHDNIKAQQVINVQGNLYQTSPPAEKVSPDNARKNYLQDLRKQCNYLPLLHIDEGDAEAQLKREDVYIDLNTTTRVPLTAKEKEERQESRQARLFERDDETRLLTAKEAAEAYTRLVILGEPGGGKTTFVFELISQIVLMTLGKEAALSPVFIGLLPVFVRLRDLAPQLESLNASALPPDKQAQAYANTLCDYAVAELSNEAKSFADELRETIQGGRCLLVLDGLDEVPHHLRALTHGAVNAVSDYLNMERVIVTCRKRSYQDEQSQLRAFTSHTLDLFDDDQVRRFAQRWYLSQKETLKGKDLEHEADELANAALAIPQDVARYPLLLTTMALIHQRDAELPNQRVILYASTVDLLLRRWQKTKNRTLQGILGKKIVMMEAMQHLAYEAHRQDPLDEDKKEGADISYKDAVHILAEHIGLGNVEEFLQHVSDRAGVLVGRGDSRGHPATYGFAHRTFQEYLAGCHIVGLRGAMERANEIFDRAANDSDWWVAITLAAEELRHNRQNGLHDLRDLMYALLMPLTKTRNAQERRAVLWAGEMAVLAGREAIEKDSEPRGGGKTFLNKLQKLLLPLLTSDLSSIEREAAGIALAKLDLDNRPEVMTLEAMQLCYVPSGAFLMGSHKDRDPQASDGELEQHEVDLPVYYLSRYPITQAQYNEFVSAGGYKNKDYWAEAITAEFWKDGFFKGRWDNEPREAQYNFNDERFNLANHPVVGVSWYEALAFTRWLTAQWRDKKLLPKNWVVTLPSEAQWEKAARGGLKIPAEPIFVTPDDVRETRKIKLVANKMPQRIYPWGDSFESNLANTGESHIGHTTAVGCFASDTSAYDTLELSGNIWEWTRSHYKKYPYAANDGREKLDASPDVTRVLRGGSCLNDCRIARCASRYWFNPLDRFDYYGFRVAVSPFFDSDL